MKRFLLLSGVLLTAAAGRAQVAYQGFDTYQPNTWTYTASPTSYNFGTPLNDMWDDTTYMGNATGTNVPIATGGQGTGFWGGWDLENPYSQTTLGLPAPYIHTLDFAPVALNTATSYTLKFKFFTHIVGGTGDSVGYQIAYDNGTSWPMTSYVNFTNANKLWDSVAVAVPAGATHVRVRFRFRINGGDDWAGVDAVQVVAGATTTPPVVAFGRALVVTDEAIDTLKIPVVLSNRNSTASTISVARVTGFGTAAWGADLQAVDTTLTWTATSPDTLYARYFVANDATAEAAEYAAVELKNSVNAGIGSLRKATFYIRDNDYAVPVARKNIELIHKGSLGMDIAGSSAEISAWDSLSNRLFIINSLKNILHIVSFDNPAALAQVDTVQMQQYGAGINSVAVRNGLVAVAVEASPKNANGKVVFLDSAGNFVKELPAGPIPDMICFSPDGRYVMTANEGEPLDDYSIDPEGSVTIIDLQGGVSNATASTVGFTQYNGQEAALRSQGIRIFGVNATAAKDFEPEYIAVNKTSDTAYVTLQENNAVAVLHLPTKTFVKLFPLGGSDHSVFGNGLDASDQSGQVLNANWPVRGMYQPDAIATYTAGGQTYFLTANEGDARDYGALKEEVRISSSAYKLDSTVFKNQDLLKANYNLGRLNATNLLGDTDGDGDFDQIYVYGSRSVAIWNGTSGAQVWNSGDAFERITAADPKYGRVFNASNDNNNLKDRSDNKGPEPEGVCVGTINDTAYAFVALERIGGVMAYDISNPAAPVFVQYTNTRDTATLGGDRGAEGILFISSKQSRTGKNYVLTSNEVSGTVAVFEINAAVPTTPPPPSNGIAGSAGQPWNVYPNPVQNSQLFFSQPATGVLTDLQGRVVRAFRSSSRLTTEGLATGTYLLRAEGLQTKKVVVE